MASREEQETTVTGNRKEGVWYVWTADPVHLRRFRKAVEEGRAVETRGSAEWGEFTVQAADYDPARGFKRRKMDLSAEQRAERSERLRLARSTL